jgi:hypothetical protein
MESCAGEGRVGVVPSDDDHDHDHEDDTNTKASN